MIPEQSFWSPFLWGIGLLVSWAGWGALVGVVVLPRGPRPDLGLAVGWGLCAMLIVGGLLNALRLALPGAAIAVMAIGWLGAIALLRPARSAAAEPAIATAKRRGRRESKDTARPRSPGFGAFVLLPLALWAPVVITASMSWHYGPINAADDLANYLMYPVKMLDTGAVIEPFNIRRLATFGGYAFLQAVLGVVTSEKHAFLLDAGLGSIAVLLLAAGELRRRGGPWWGVYPIAAVCWLFPMPRGNSMCAWIGTATVLTLVRTASLRAGEPAGPTRLRLLGALAMAAAACCSLRANYLPIPSLFLAGVLVWELVARRASPSAVLRDGAVLAAGFVALLLPWSLALYQSSGSLLYPLMKGNHRAAFFSYADPAPIGRKLAHAATLLASPSLLKLVPAVLIAPFVREGAGVALAAAAILTSVLTAVVYTSADLDAIARYTVPLLLAPALFGIAVLLAERRERRAWLPRALAVGCTLLMLGTSPVTWWRVLDSQGSAAVEAFGDRQPAFRAPIYQLIAETQASIPAGATLASLIDFPSLWDYRRNRIECLDFPGAAVPHGPMPFFAGPEPVLEYLRREGFDYLAYLDFDRTKGLYRREWYQRLVGSDFKPMDQVSPRALDFMANVEKLAATQPLAFDRDGMKVIRLR